MFVTCTWLEIGKKMGFAPTKQISLSAHSLSVSLFFFSFFSSKAPFVLPSFLLHACNSYFRGKCVCVRALYVPMCTKECIEERKKRRSPKLNDFKETKERRWEVELGLEKKAIRRKRWRLQT
jgi:hypothetical protein